MNKATTIDEYLANHKTYRKAVPFLNALEGYRWQHNIIQTRFSQAINLEASSYSQRIANKTSLTLTEAKAIAELLHYPSVEALYDDAIGSHDLFEKAAAMPDIIYALRHVGSDNLGSYHGAKYFFKDLDKLFNEAVGKTMKWKAVLTNVEGGANYPTIEFVDASLRTFSAMYRGKLSGGLTLPSVLESETPELSEVREGKRDFTLPELSAVVEKLIEMDSRLKRPGRSLPDADTKNFGKRLEALHYGILKIPRPQFAAITSMTTKSLFALENGHLKNPLAPGQKDGLLDVIACNDLEFSAFSEAAVKVLAVQEKYFSETVQAVQALNYANKQGEKLTYKVLQNRYGVGQPHISGNEVPSYTLTRRIASQMMTDRVTGTWSIGVEPDRKKYVRTQESFDDGPNALVALYKRAGIMDDAGNIPDVEIVLDDHAQKVVVTQKDFELVEHFRSRFFAAHPDFKPEEEIKR